MVPDRCRFEYFSSISFCVDDIVLLDPERIISLMLQKFGTTLLVDSCFNWNSAAAFKYSAPLMLFRILKSNIQVSFHNLAKVFFSFFGCDRKLEEKSANPQPSTLIRNRNPVSFARWIPVFWGILGHNWSKSYCFRVQPVTCRDLLIFLY